MRTLTQTLIGTRAAVVGAGGSGRAAARLLHALGARVRVMEREEGKVCAAFSSFIWAGGHEFVFGPHRAEHFADIDLVVPSPGIPIARLAPLFPADRKLEVMAEMELAWRQVTSPVLAVTGTNGKTTTVSLCEAMLRESGRRVFLGGNIGTPLSEYVLSEDWAENPADVVVLEASSFQLQTCSTFRPAAGVLLNITPDHLDYHDDMAEYLEAKLKLFSRQGPDDLAVFPRHMHVMAERVAARETGQGPIVAYYEDAEPFVCPSLPGPHNQDNIRAAFTACAHFGVSRRTAQGALDRFRGLPHRLERVGEVDGVIFVNDSKATTVDSLRAALESFEAPIHLLAGGVYKGGDLRGLLPLVKAKVKGISLFGQSREVFQTSWTNGSGTPPISWGATMEEGFAKALEAASPGDVVLLSPATASFDLYVNYKARGEHFKRLAQQHAQSRSGSGASSGGSSNEGARA